MKRVLFVCTGNTCRSPMAEALLRHYGEDAFEVQSAGVFAASGSQASTNARLALAEKGIATDHTAQQLNEELLEWADVVLTMTDSHRQTIAAYYPDFEEKVHLLYQYIDEKKRDISDPYGGSLEVYKETLEELSHLLQRFMKKHADH